MFPGHLPFSDDTFAVLYNSYMLDLIPIADFPVVLKEFQRVFILIPPANSRTLTERIPGAKLVEFPGGGHGYHTQFHQRVAEEVRDFLG